MMMIKLINQKNMVMSNLKLLRKALKTLNLDYFILPNNDEFSNEYLPKNVKRLEFITDFTGSNAVIIVGQKKAAFFTDGRYTIQAAAEVNNKDYEIYNLADKSWIKWLLENSQNNDKIGFDSKLHSISAINYYQKILEKRKIVFLKENPVDQIWSSRLKAPTTKVFIHDSKYAGISSEKKIKIITKNFGKNAEALILNSPISICWLLNIRATDIDFTPIALCYAIIYKNGKVDLFIDEKRLDEKVKKHLKNVKIIAPENLEKNILLLKNKKIQIDQNYCNYWLTSILQKSEIIEATDPCLIHKACKNSIEIKGMIKAHEIDGLAVTKFLLWLKNEAKNIDEIKAAKKLLEFRKQNKEFFSLSFETISGFASNGAIVHYRVTKKTNKKIEGNSLYLVDSGGQYFSGTTDITRTIAVGKPTSEQKHNFTLVLKGHIALATAEFSNKTTGSDLDILARQFLQKEGKDYDHGTGHGVGCFLSVHEGPQNISKRKNEIYLKPGMIISNEPGYYKSGEYGIRIENLVLVEKSKKKGFLKFKTITLAPIDLNLIDFKLLTEAEKSWVYNYHQEIYKKLKLTKLKKIQLKKIIDFK